MFVCVFAKKFPALASQSCCEVSRPRAVGEYEYRPFFITNGRLQYLEDTSNIPSIRWYISLETKLIDGIFD